MSVRCRPRQRIRGVEGIIHSLHLECTCTRMLVTFVRSNYVRDVRPCHLC